MDQTMESGGKVLQKLKLYDYERNITLALVEANIMQNMLLTSVIIITGQQFKIILIFMHQMW